MPVPFREIAYTEIWEVHAWLSFDTNIVEHIMNSVIFIIEGNTDR